MAAFRNKLAAACVMAMVLAMVAGQARAQNPSDSRAARAASADPFGADPLALAVLERRCPEILADPTWYDDDIIALCLQARRRK